MSTLSQQPAVKSKSPRSRIAAKSAPQQRAHNGTPAFWLIFLSGVVLAVGLMFYLNRPRSNSTLPVPALPEDHALTGSTSTTKGPLTLADIPFNGERAYEHLLAICELGPRKSGSQAMLKQQAMLQQHFTAIGGKVERQEFDTTDPNDGSPVTMTNLIVRWHPERQQRILICAHYDTRPFPDQDRRDPRGVFIGANDGASGTALLCELGRHMPQLESKYGIDFVLFDGEELVYSDRRDRDRYFLGSKYFAQQYVRSPPPHRYVGGVLLDMVGDADLQLYYEKNSLKWPDTRPMVRDIWSLADKLGVDEFIPRPRHEIRDDHLPLRNTAGIPTLDIIDFDYPKPGSPSYWHTTQDTADKCSALSLAKVGWVLHEWLKVVE